MSTPTELEASGILLRLDPDLDPGELPVRMIYALPRIEKWVGDVLPGLQTDGYHEGAPSPAQQLAACLADFAIGVEPGDLPPHLAHPKGEGIWEIRTYDLRLFGWFWSKGVFILSAVGLKADMASGRIPTSNYVKQAIGDRDRMELNEPKFLPGGYDDVFRIELPAKERASGRFMGRALRNLAKAAFVQMKRHRISQSKVAAELEVDKAMISRILKGGANPTLRTIGEVAWAFRLRPELTFHPIEEVQRNHEPARVHFEARSKDEIRTPVTLPRSPAMQANKAVKTGAAKPQFRLELEEA